MFINAGLSRPAFFCPAGCGLNFRPSLSAETLSALLTGVFKDCRGKLLTVF
jgi:hypothetical protein